MGLHGCHNFVRLSNWKLDCYWIAIFLCCSIHFPSSKGSEPTSTVSSRDSLLAEDTSVPPLPTTSSCFYAEENLCLLPFDVNGCRECMQHPTQLDSLICCNVTDIEKSISCAPKVEWTNIHMRNVSVDELDISDKFWKRLTSLVITDGHINKITKEFPKFSSPKCINVSNNNLMVINQRAFKDLTPLQVLDLSHNNLSTIPNLNSIQGNLSIDIRWV